jgi:hypothetical protein
MAKKARPKNLIRDMLYMRLNGPGTAVLDSVWKAVLRATVTSEAGHTQKLG